MRLKEARHALEQVVVQYTALAILDVSSPSDSDGVPTEFLTALQLKACLRRQTKATTVTMLARENAEMLCKDIMSVAAWLNPAIVSDATRTDLSLTRSQQPCEDIVAKCSMLSAAIREDTRWPEPFMGRESTADRWA